MIEIIRSIVLGVIQGLTEFLPVSSSGHLEIAKYILGEDAVGQESMMMTVVLHFATALSTISFVINIIISMIPAALVGVFMEDILEQLFNKNLILVCSMLVVTGLLLFRQRRGSKIFFSDGRSLDIWKDGQRLTRRFIYCNQCQYGRARCRFHSCLPYGTCRLYLDDRIGQKEPTQVL